RAKALLSSATAAGNRITTPPTPRSIRSAQRYSARRRLRSYHLKLPPPRGGLPSPVVSDLRPLLIHARTAVVSISRRREGRIKAVLQSRHLPVARLGGSYAIGTAGSFWLVQRLWLLFNP